MEIVKLEKINKKYICANGETIEVLKNLSLKVRPGEFAVFSGRSGIGKSTLLNIIGGIDTADSGDYTYKGRKIKKGRCMPVFLKRQIGFVMQDDSLISNITVLDNVCMPLKYRGAPFAKRRSAALEALYGVGLIGKEKCYPFELSGGQLRRVSLARAAVYAPELLIADEPTASLDKESTGAVTGFLKKMRKVGTTVIAATHDPELIACASVKYEIKNGRL